MKKVVVGALLIAVMLVGCTTASAPKIPSIVEGFGIYGADVEISGMYSGWVGVVTIAIINGEDRDRLFAIYADTADPAKLREGFEVLPEEYLCWFTVEEPEVAVGVGEAHEVSITVTMPKGADYAGKHAEVRIRVDDITQTGLVRIALESRWFITTAN